MDGLSDSISVCICINSYAIAALLTAVTGGEADDWLEQVTAYLTANRGYFIEEVRRRKLPIHH